METASILHLTLLHQPTEDAKHSTSILKNAQNALIDGLLMLMDSVFLLVLIADRIYPVESVLTVTEDMI